MNTEPILHGMTTQQIQCVIDRLPNRRQRAQRYRNPTDMRVIAVTSVATAVIVAAAIFYFGSK